jgi:hypothetical protein
VSGVSRIDATVNLLHGSDTTKTERFVNVGDGTDVLENQPKSNPLESFRVYGCGCGFGYGI